MSGIRGTFLICIYLAGLWGGFYKPTYQVAALQIFIKIQEMHEYHRHFWNYLFALEVASHTIMSDYARELSHSHVVSRY